MTQMGSWVAETVAPRTNLKAPCSGLRAQIGLVWAWWRLALFPKMDVDAKPVLDAASIQLVRTSQKSLPEVRSLLTAAFPVRWVWACDIIFAQRK